jgi:hypothetical protein
MVSTGFILKRRGDDGSPDPAPGGEQPGIVDPPQDSKRPDKRFRYYYPSRNTALLPTPFLVTSASDLQRLKADLREIDVEATLLKDR